MEPWTRTHVIGLCAIAVTMVVALCTVYLSSASTRKRTIAAFAIFAAGWVIALVISPQLRTIHQVVKLWLSPKEEPPKNPPVSAQLKPDFSKQFTPKTTLSSAQNNPVPTPFYLLPTPSVGSTPMRFDADGDLLPLELGKLPQPPVNDGLYYIAITNETGTTVWYAIREQKWTFDSIEPGESKWVKWKPGFGQYVSFEKSADGSAADADFWPINKSVENKNLPKKMRALVPIYRLAKDSGGQITLKEAREP